MASASPALKFVLMVGVMSFFADFTYEGSRSIIGPYLGLLGAGAFAISVISGVGELLGYGLRLFSGRGADRTGRYWPITIGGYVLQMSVVPLLALAGKLAGRRAADHPERVGKAIRNPPRDAMLSHAAKEMGYGWGFGVHEALDQFGALFGPLLVALVLAVSHHDYKIAFAAAGGPRRDHAVAAGRRAAAVPAATGPRGRPARSAPRGCHGCSGCTSPAAALVAAGFADFPLIAYHFQRSGTVSAALTPVFYAAAMAVSGAGSLVFGRLFDRCGIGMLVPLTVVGRLCAAGVPRRVLGEPGRACPCGVSAWACTSRSSRRRSPRWSPPTAGPPPTACSPASTARRG